MRASARTEHPGGASWHYCCAMISRRVLTASLALALAGCGQVAAMQADGATPTASDPGAADARPASQAPTVDGSTLEPSEGFDVTRLTFTAGDRRIAMPSYVADTPELRSLGLMFRDDLPDEVGMVFVYGEPQQGAFWMMNTKIPLSIAFIGQDGTVQQVMDMEPCTAEPCARYRPDDAYVLAVEANQGYFAERGIGPGWTVESDDVGGAGA